MRVHVLQIGYDDTEPVAARVERVAGLVAEQRGADLVVLPELWAPTGMGYRRWADAAEALDGPTVAAIADAARACGAYVHAGSIVETVPAGSPPDLLGPEGRGRWNTSVLLDRSGATLATYRKVHRFGFAAGEPTLLEAGERVVTADLEVDGRSVRLGLATCYDLRFPELFRRLLDDGALGFVVPAAWPLPRVGHWSLLGRARAIENQCALIACNTAGTHAGVIMGGASQVVDAAGTVLAEAGPAEQVLVAEVDVAAIESWRQTFPVLADRRLQ